MPTDEYKIIAFVFCTLVDMDNKKIDLVDFVKRFYGREENPFQAFIKQMVVPFRNLLAEAFGYKKLALDDEEQEAQEDDYDEDEHEEDDDENEEEPLDDDTFKRVQKIAVQIISELQYYHQSQNNADAITVCKAIVKTCDLRDSEITYSLGLALKACKAKQVKFLVREMLDLLDI